MSMQRDTHSHQAHTGFQVLPRSLPQPKNRHAARDRQIAFRARLEAEKAEARALGVLVIDKPPAANRRWTEPEDIVLRELADRPLREIRAKLPHRSEGAIRRRRADLDLTPPRAFWTNQDIDLLKKNTAKIDIVELCKLFPKRTIRQDQSKCVHLGIHRGTAPLTSTGNWLCDAIRDRCRELGYSMRKLDGMAKTGTYFEFRSWHAKEGHRWVPMVKAARMLGGELRVEWPD